MAYTDDAVLAKLSALNETQESIVTVAQWVMFHRRHADRTGQLWLQRLKDSGSNKRLNLVYLANEVAQQSKARRKDDFLIAFSPVIAEATATAYKGATNDVQQKLRRVIEVWRQRAIFEPEIQNAIESRIEEIDKTKSTKKGSLLSGSIFSSGTSSSIPAELTPLVAPQQSISKLVLSTKTSVNAANAEYEKHTDPAAPIPSAPVHAARLNGLLKTLANAEGAVAESIKARTQLIEGLEKLLTINRAALIEEQTQLDDIGTRRSSIDAKKREVEDSIMRGFASNSNPGTPGGVGNGSDTVQTPGTPAEPDRPEVEALTPPAYEAFTPEPEDNGFGSPGPVGVQQYNQQPKYTEPPAAPAHAGADLLSSLSTTYPNPVSTGENPLKKRKLNDGDFPDFGGDGDLGLDADVEEMLRKDNGKLD